MADSDSTAMNKYRKALLLQQQLQAHHRTDVVDLPTSALEPNPLQPRRSFDPETMAELRSSIAQHGILEPLVVRPLAPGRYQIVIGERRWRCAQEVGLATVPAIIRRLSDEEAFRFSLVENLQRSNLSPIEEARAYRYMLDQGMAENQQQVAEMLGIAPQRVSEKLRLLDLPAEIQERVAGREDADPASGTISERHARALLRLPDHRLQLEAFEQIVTRRLATRQAEQLVDEMLQGERLPTGRRRQADEAAGDEAAAAEAPAKGGMRGPGASAEQKTRTQEALAQQLEPAPSAPGPVSVRPTPHGFVMRVEYDRRFVTLATIHKAIVDVIVEWAEKEQKE
ncbi:MAG: ParB/RepB/Spo0J family partition protein [Armatimonadetes bacterium]|nr:ParB/RepB/Spo0J family partition protein [Armatimonadota bacterium]